MKQTSNSPIRVEVGAGSSSREDYVKCDVRPMPNVDVVCEAWALPFGVRTVDDIFSRHMLEHLSLSEAIRALNHWYAVLKVGGKLDINVPDLDKTLEQLSRPGKSEYVPHDVSNRMHAMCSLYGWQVHFDDFHKWAYTFESLKDLLEQCGFEQVTRMEDDSGSGPLNLRVQAIKSDTGRPEILDPASRPFRLLIFRVERRFADIYNRLKRRVLGRDPENPRPLDYEAHD